MAGYSRPSPKGRTIEHVEGEPDAIIDRGNQITRLGEDMKESASLLEDVANRALAGQTQKGKAIEALRESIGDSYETLRESGELYEPVGPLLTGYGHDLARYQPLLNRSADRCEDLWASYMSQDGSMDGSMEAEEGGFLGIGETDEEEAANNRAKKQAFENWEHEAEQFDSFYDSWEDAFDHAANHIGDEMSGTIEDSVWSDIVDVLKVVGTIVAIAALFTGIGALVWLGVGIGVAATAATYMQTRNGEAGWGDVAMSALGIIPVTKVSKVAGAGATGVLSKSAKAGAAKFGRSMGPSGAANGSMWRIGEDSVVNAWRNGGLSGTGRFLATGNSRGAAGHFDDAARAAGYTTASGGQLYRAAQLSQVQAGASGIGNAVNVNTWAGNLGMPHANLPPYVTIPF